MLHARDRRHCRMHLAFQRTGQTVWAGRTLFLWAVSHTPALCDLARPPHSRSADLDVPADLHPGAHRPRGLGHALGERNKHADEQAAFSVETKAPLSLLFLYLF